MLYCSIDEFIFTAWPEGFICSLLPQPFNQDIPALVGQSYRLYFLFFPRLQRSLLRLFVTIWIPISPAYPLVSPVE